MRILLVEDDTEFGPLLAQRFRTIRDDVTVVEVRSGAAAEAALEAGPFDFLVSDVAMESRDAGWRVARSAQARGIAVLLITGDERSVEFGDGSTIPLVAKMELARLDPSELLECLLASQRPPAH